MWKSGFGGGFGKKFKPAKPKAVKAPLPAAPRNRGFETILCEAIRHGVTVELRYDGTDGIDRSNREFGPAVVHYSTANAARVCVSGQVLNNSDEPSKIGPCDFEVGKIVSLSLTDRPFKPDPRLDLTNAKFRNGIICKPS